MKVYKSIINGLMPNPVWTTMKIGDLFYEDNDNYLPAKGGYPIQRKTIEESANFERIEDDPHTAAYYIDKIYTQADYDKILTQKIH